MYMPSIVRIQAQTQNKLSLFQAPASARNSRLARVSSSQLRGISDRTLEWRNHLSNVLEVLRQSIGASTLGVGLVAALNMWIVQHAIPSDSPWLQWLDESKVVVIGGFLSFLLVFRTNTCYARWWEARCHWGNIVYAALAIWTDLAETTRGPFRAPAQDDHRLCVC